MRKSKKSPVLVPTDGEGYLGPRMSDKALTEALSKAPDCQYALEFKTAPPLASSFPWLIVWEEGPKKGGPDSAQPVRHERRFRTVKARNAWIDLISSKPTFIRFVYFEDPGGDLD